jgi:hypothetical protein
MSGHDDNKEDGLDELGRLAKENSLERQLKENSLERQRVIKSARGDDLKEAISSLKPPSPQAITIEKEIKDAIAETPIPAIRSNDGGTKESGPKGNTYRFFKNIPVDADGGGFIEIQESERGLYHPNQTIDVDGEPKTVVSIGACGITFKAGLKIARQHPAQGETK